VTLSEWAEANRILDPLNCAEPGRWKNRRTPYLVGPMDACTDRRVQFVVLMFPAQVGKTEVLLNFLGYVIDQDPGTGLLVYPTENDTKKIISHRVRPLFTFNPKLMAHVGSVDDLGLKELAFDRCTFFPAWSNSPSALASTPCRYVINDEVDKFPPFAGKEASPVKLSEVRTTTFRGRRKILISSTPRTEDDVIWGEYQRSNQQTYWVPCIRCGHYQTLDFYKGLKWPEGGTADGVKAARAAWYQCEACEFHIQNAQKFPMIRSGVWVPRGMKVAPTGELTGPDPYWERSGFHLNALVSPWVTFSDLASEFIAAKGDIGAQMAFRTQRMGMPWKEKIETVKDAQLRRRVKDYKQGAAPAGGLRMTAGVDVQEDHFWFVVRVWGEGERSWLVRQGTCATWKELERVLFTAYRVGGASMKVECAFIDSGYNDDAVYKFARRHRPIVNASKGYGGARLQPFKWAHPRPGVRRGDFNADFWKDRLASFIQTDDDEPRAWCLPRDLPPDYFQHMTSESRVFTRRFGRLFSTWEPMSSRAPNHLWDCEVLNCVAADSIGVRYLEGEELAAKAAPPAPGPARGPDGEPWLETGDSWLGGGGSIWEQ
jgi:phage terminase large subunit GpA-like protein